MPKPEKEFKKAANVNDIKPGEMKMVQVNDTDVCLVNVDGEFCAISNACAHHGGPLADGALEGDVVTCPWHGWKFSVKTGGSPVAKTVKVDCFEVKIEGSDVLVGTEPK